MGIYYDGTKLLSMKDINGEQPEIYAVVGNRTGGKTTYFGRLLINRFLKRNEKFMLLYRWGYEVSDVAEKFFKDIGALFFPEYEMSSKNMNKGVYANLYLNDKHCGYAVSINTADNIKKIAHLFSDTQNMFFDEFMPESNNYCNKEIEKLLSIHTSVARGQGKQVRYVPLFMASNSVTLLNPYFTEWDISNRLKKDTKFLRCDGLVLEQTYNETAAYAQTTSAFNRAFSKNKYVEYASQNVYLNDNYAFIDKPEGYGKYLFTVKYMNKLYSVLEYESDGVIYVSDKADISFPVKFSLTTNDHAINYVMLAKNDFIISHYRKLFEYGCFRFKNLACKEMILKLLSY